METATIVGFGMLVFILLFVITWLYRDHQDGTMIIGVPDGERSYLQKVVDGLEKKGCVFYGRQGCSWCDRQKALFAAELPRIKYVDCSGSPEPCQGIRGFPTWRDARGKEIFGYATLEKLVETFALPI